MQSLGYDLIVDDDGIIQEAGKIVEKTEDFEQKLGELSDILSNVLDDAIMQGNTAEISCCLQMKCWGYGQKHRR